jgi:hypothetical protein
LISRTALMMSLNFRQLKQPQGNSSKIVAHRVDENIVIYRVKPRDKAYQ